METERVIHPLPPIGSVIHMTIGSADKGGPVVSYRIAARSYHCLPGVFRADRVDGCGDGVKFNFTARHYHYNALLRTEVGDAR